MTALKLRTVGSALGAIGISALLVYVGHLLLAFAAAVAFDGSWFTAHALPAAGFAALAATIAVAYYCICATSTGAADFFYVLGALASLVGLFLIAASPAAHDARGWHIDRLVIAAFTVAIVYGVLGRRSSQRSPRTA